MKLKDTVKLIHRPVTVLISTDWDSISLSRDRRRGISSINLAQTGPVATRPLRSLSLTQATDSRAKDFLATPGQDDGWINLTHLYKEPADRDRRYVSAAARAHLEAWITAAALARGSIFVSFNRNGGQLARVIHEVKGRAR